MPHFSQQHSRLNHIHRLLLGSLLSCTLLGCADTNEAEGTDVRARDNPEMLELRRQSGERKLLERVPPPAQTVVGEVPLEVMETALLALEKLTGAQRSEFETVQAEEVMWPDGALGCPQPGMHYTQAPVAGYHIVLRHKGRDYDYRAGGTSFLMLCLEPSGGIPPGTTPPKS